MERSLGHSSECVHRGRGDPGYIFASGFVQTCFIKCHFICHTLFWFSNSRVVLRPRSVRSEMNEGRGQRVGRDEDAVPNSVSVAPWDVKYI